MAEQRTTPSAPAAQPSTGVSFKLGSSSTSTANKRKQTTNIEGNGTGSHSDVTKDKRDYVVSISGNQVESLVPEVLPGPLVIPLPNTSQTPVKIHKKYLTLVNGLNTIVTPTDTTTTPATPTTDNATDKSTTKSTETVQALDSADGMDIVAQPSVSETTSASQPAQKTLTEDEEAADALLKEAEAIARGDFVDAPVGADLPLLLKFRNTELDKIDDEEQRFRADVASRPDEADLDGYDRVPIEQFGAAMLRGMGWSEGAPIGVGQNAKVVPVTEFVSRPGYRTGLGATPLAAPPPKKKKIIKPGESREPKEPQVLADADGNIKSIRRNGEALTPLSKVGLHEGSLVGIVQGPHDGLYARVLKIFSTTGELLVRLDPSEEEVTVSKDDVTQVDEKRLNQNHPALLFAEKTKSHSSKKDKVVEDKKQKEDTTDKDKKKSSSKSTEQPSRSEGHKSWMFPNLVVRIVSKSFSGGKYYLKKGTIVDVIDMERCTMQLLENKKHLLEVKQTMLETVVPKVGERIMVVLGKDKGRTGVIMDKPKGTERASVQTSGDLQINNYDLDSICQYTGEDLDR